MFVEEWTTVRCCSTMAECKSFILGEQMVDSENQPLRFKWAYPWGNGKTNAYFACASHVDCPVRARASLRDGGMFLVCINMGVLGHASEASLKRRMNSCMTIQQEEYVKTGVNQGVKPATLLSCMTIEKLSEDNAHGRQLEKRDAGGLAGMFSRHVP